MNINDPKYNKYSLVKEMLETVGVVKNFDPMVVSTTVEKIKDSKRFFLTGEGSSRIFPAKRAIYENAKGDNLVMATEGATQALEYDLSDAAVFGASNSGKTKELVRLYKSLESKGHNKIFSVTATPQSVIEGLSQDTHVLACGPEQAVAATKSVVEQALSYHATFAGLQGKKVQGLAEAGAAIEKVLTAVVSPEIISALAKGGTIYFAGRNNGVAEELTLKTNEITRRPSGYLEGTYAVHGIEEVMTEKDAVVIVDPFESEEEKFEECLVKGVGMPVVAIASRKTRFPTFEIPSVAGFDPYLQLAAGWSLLVEVGIALGVDLDKPQRARKVGNEFLG